MERRKAESTEMDTDVKYQTFKSTVSKADTNTTYTIEDAIDASGFGIFQIKLSLIAGFGWVADAMEIMLLAIIGPVLVCEWRLNSVEESFITVLVFTGFMFGALAFGAFADKFGRKTSLIFGSCWALFYGVLSGFAPNYSWLLILRCLTGFGIGGVPQVVTYYSEFLPSKARGKCLVLIEVFWAIGGLLEVVLAMLVLIPLGWRPWLILSAFPLLLFIPMFLVMPESPRYCMIAGRYDEAVKTLEKVAETNKMSLPQGKLEENVKVKRGQTRDLFIEDLRKTTILLWIIWFCGAFSYYGMILMSTELIRMESTCPEKLLGEDESDCYIDCKLLSKEDYKKLLWTSVSEIPGLFITALCVDTLGRKLTMIIEFLVFSVICFLLIICQSGPILIVSLFVGRAMAACALQVCYVYTPEVYPTASRAVGMGWGCGWARFGAIVTPFIAQVVLGASVWGCLVVYASFGMLGAICTFLLPVETKGKHMRNTIDFTAD